MYKLIITFVLFFVAFSCQNNSFKKHSSGLQYKFIVKSSKRTTPKLGDVLLIKVSERTSDNKLIDETDYFKIKLAEPSYLGGAIEDGLALMSVGDSLHIKLNANEYFTQTKKIELPEGVEDTSNLIVAIRLAELIDASEFEKDQDDFRISCERKEDKQLEQFIKMKNIEVPPLLSGMYYIETCKGEGKQPVPGKSVVIHYSGAFLDGQIFDSSVERGTPFVFKLGVGEVIQGLEEGVSRMRVGGKATLIIPSSLAYGDELVSVIPPFSTLVFDIELLDVSN